MRRNKLLSRDEFRNAVFERDKHTCVCCFERAKDAHHIIERRLFSDGGYYLDNGASLCEKHHILAEQTLITCNELRSSTNIGVENVVLPDHLYDDMKYDKWGNVILPSGNRLKGELFFDESVQKILKEGDVLDLFVKYQKYPRTYHTPDSNLSKDDRMMPDYSGFLGKRVIGTLKMDGENTTMYSDYMHARSIDSPSDETRKWVKGLWSQIGYMLDDNMRICGENLYAVHSMRYADLPSYFMMFSMWIDNRCLSWDETVQYAAILGLNTVPVFYDGIFDLNAIKNAWKPYEKTNEGYVIRIADEFTYMQFRKVVGKYVRPEFRKLVNNSHGHWRSKPIEMNQLTSTK